MELFADANLVDKTGAPAKLAVAPDVVTAIFFSSSWCPDCVPFVGTLAAMYEELNEDDKVLEVVFVSSDRDAASMAAYMSDKHSDWLAVAYVVCCMPLRCTAAGRRVQQCYTVLHRCRGSACSLFFARSVGAFHAD